MKNNSGVISLVIMVLMIIIYIVNFVQMIVAISEESWNTAIIKAIGVLTVLGSLITVWF